MRTTEAGPFGLIARFATDAGGQVAVTFGICLVVLVTAIGGGLDLSHAFVARQELSHAASLTCQYSTRPPVLSTSYSGSSGVTTYVSNVNSYSTVFLTSEKFPLTQTNTAPFAYVPGGASTVSYNASMPTNFLRIVGLNSIPVGVTITCNANETQVSETQSPNVFTESFENAACDGNCFTWIKPDGSRGAPSSVTNTFPPKAAYVGATNAEWSIMGYCLEIDKAGRTVSTAADGSYVAELDCDNGSGSAGNSSISNKNYYTAGTYELRYDYQARIQYPNYQPIYICGSAAADLAWANDATVFIMPFYRQGYGSRTNQINVYFDQDNAGAPPTHTTLDGTQTLGGSNLVDECVDSSAWVERSVKITVTTPGYYWVSFAADGFNDSYGGQLDYIRMCRNSCSGSVQDNFPSAWTSSPALFEDTFESPTYTGNPYAWIAKNGNLSNSLGTSGSSSGWPSQSSSGWGTGPYNQVLYFLQGAAQGNQYIGLDGNNAYSSYTPSSTTYSTLGSTNDRLISRPFYLVPGYYEVDYNYLSEMNFANSGPFCTAAPSSGYIYPATYPAATGTQRFSGTQYTKDGSDNLLGVFMAHGSLVSTPDIIAPNTSNSLGATTTFTNPNNTDTTTPTVPPDAVNWSNYDSTQVNPVIDVCGYAPNYTWVARTTYVKITKPGPYWLTFSANGGLADGKGPSLDDVRLKALNSPYGAAPSFYVTIPTPGPAPGSTVSFTGFSIIADRFAP